MTSGAALDRLVGLVDSPANGVTVCTGSLGADPDNDLPAILRRRGMRQGHRGADSLHALPQRQAHRRTRSFHESPHPSAFGSVDMLEVMRALREIGYAGPMRPDHGRMIWGETGRPGYGLYDRALGAMYLQGLWEAVVGMQTERRGGGECRPVRGSRCGNSSASSLSLSKSHELQHLQGALRFGAP